MMVAWDDTESAALVALLRARPDGLSWPELAALVSDARSAESVWRERVPEGLFDMGPTAELRQAAERDVAAWRQASFGFATFMDEHYPSRLRDVHQVPPVIFWRGELLREDRGVSVVGSRRASAAGMRFASRVSTGLVEAGVTVIAGLAEGIDTAAHEAALSAGGRTVAVIGTGINRYYPKPNAGLQDEIANRGVVLSQFWPDAPPTPKTFPMRNAVMSAYGHATVVVEASEKSGTRIQAREAIQHGRPVILSEAVVRSTNWGNAMIGRPGVQVARTPEEAVQMVHETFAMDGRVEKLLALAGS